MGRSMVQATGREGQGVGDRDKRASARCIPNTGTWEQVMLKSLRPVTVSNGLTYRQLSGSAHVIGAMRQGYNTNGLRCKRRKQIYRCTRLHGVHTANGSLTETRILGEKVCASACSMHHPTPCSLLDCYLAYYLLGACSMHLAALAKPGAQRGGASAWGPRGRSRRPKPGAEDRTSDCGLWTSQDCGVIGRDGVAFEKARARHRAPARRERLGLRLLQHTRPPYTSHDGACAILQREHLDR